MKMTMTAAGDSILHQGYPDKGYPGFDEVRAWIARGQAKFGNLETCVTEFDTYASAYCGGTWIACRPRILDQILAFGFDFLGFANNHSMDWGPDGLLQTLRRCRDKGVAVAGAGKNLADAAAPVCRTFEGGRVAFLAVTSSFDDAARAGDASRTIPGRPGLNALRPYTVYYVNEAHFKAVQEVVEATAPNGSADLSRKNGFLPPLPKGVCSFGGVSLRLSPDGKEYKKSSCNKHDLARVLDAVKDAKLLADYVVVMFHSHQIRGDRMDEPDEFAVEFCHACIDAGVDVILGNGTHEFKPVEIYKGKPIFYSVGNFCFQSNVLEHQPADMLERFDLPALSDVQGIAARNKGWTIGLHTQPQNFRTALPYLEFEDGVLTRLEMMPVELGFEKTRTFKGIPYPANEKQSKEIFETLEKISREQFGTRMTFEDGRIVVDLKGGENE